MTMNNSVIGDWTQVHDTLRVPSNVFEPYALGDVMEKTTKYKYTGEVSHVHIRDRNNVLQTVVNTESNQGNSICAFKLSVGLHIVTTYNVPTKDVNGLIDQLKLGMSDDIVTETYSSHYVTGTTSALTTSSFIPDETLLSTLLGNDLYSDTSDIVISCKYSGEVSQHPFSKTGRVSSIHADYTSTSSPTMVIEVINRRAPGSCYWFMFGGKPVKVNVTKNKHLQDGIYVSVRDPHRTMFCVTYYPLDDMCNSGIFNSKKEAIDGGDGTLRIRREHEEKEREAKYKLQAMKLNEARVIAQHKEDIAALSIKKIEREAELKEIAIEREREMQLAVEEARSTTNMYKTIISLLGVAGAVIGLVSVYKKS